MASKSAANAKSAPTQAGLAPSPVIGSQPVDRDPLKSSRLKLSHLHGHQIRNQETSTSSTARPTPAEAYASAHNQKRDKENNTPHPAGSGSHHQQQQQQNHHIASIPKTKPLFEWITRKLGGAGRRATYSDGSAPGPNDYRSREGESRSRRKGPNRQSGVVKGSNNPMSPTHIFGPAVSTRDNSIMTRSESHSLRSYSLSLQHANSVERRIANNPYPSIPVTTLPAFQRDLTFDTVSESFLSRSRTPSLRSEGSKPVRFLGDLDDHSSKWTTGGADEDASIRPFPPSHPSSPTPSQSLLTRSASASLLSPAVPGLPRPSSYLAARTHRSMSTSTGSSDMDLVDGRQSRQDSTSTKPTILSFDSSQQVAHIAQAPAPVSAPVPHIVPPPLPHLSHSTPASPLRYTQMNGSEHRDASSALSSPGGIASSIRPNDTPTSLNRALASTAPSSPDRAQRNHFQAPKHSHHHPEDNPAPLAPTHPNASTLTLASSTFAIPNTPYPSSPLSPALNATHYQAGSTASRIRDITTSGQGFQPTTRSSMFATSPSVTFASEPLNERPISTYDYASSAYAPSAPSVYALSTYGPSLGPTSIRTGGRRGAADRDASVRALRRNGSASSNESGWSWRDQIYAGGPTPSITGSNGPMEGGARGGGNLGNPIANRLSAYTNQDEDALSTFYANAGSSVARDSYMGQSKLSRESTHWGDGGDDQTPGMEDRRFDLDRGGTPIIA